MDLRKVYGGTPVGNASRCDTCVYSRIIRGYASNEKIVFCDRIYDPIRIPFPVAECTDYSNRNLPHIEDLKKIAIPIEVRRERATGFVTISDVAVAVRDEDEYDD